MSGHIDYAAIPAPGPWAESAACKGRTAEFFAWENASFGRVSADLRVLCDGCTVRPQCLSYAIRHDVDGIWAGTTWKQRRRMGRTA